MVRRGRSALVHLTPLRPQPRPLSPESNIRRTQCRFTFARVLKGQGAVRTTPHMFTAFAALLLLCGCVNTHAFGGGETVAFTYRYPQALQCPQVGGRRQGAAQGAVASPEPPSPLAMPCCSASACMCTHALRAAAAEARMAPLAVLDEPVRRALRPGPPSSSLALAPKNQPHTSLPHLHTSAADPGRPGRQPRHRHHRRACPAGQPLHGAGCAVRLPRHLHR